MNRQVYGEPIVVGGAMRMPLSRAVRAGDWVFLSGVAAIDASGVVVSGGIEAQTKAVLEVIRDTLKLADCEMGDVVKATVWLDDTRDFWNFNRVYSTFFPDDPPARSTLKSELMLDAKVEIEVLAYKPL